MAERLNHLAYAQGGGHHSSNFNPRSVSLDIRTPEELAAVNEFLITLGRDVAGGPGRQNGVPSQSNYNSSDNYFDPNNLSNLGLSGMPGLPGSNFSDHSYGNAGPAYSSYPSRSHSSIPQQAQPTYMYGGGMNEQPISYNGSGYSQNQPSSRRPSRYNPQYYNHPTPPLDSGGSPPSSVSTPLNTTPPHMPIAISEMEYKPHQRRPEVPMLSAPKYMSANNIHTTIPMLQTPPTGARPAPIQARLPLSEHRARRPSAPAASSSVSRGPLYPKLSAVEGDHAFKLPPLREMYRSPSPPSRESTPSSVDSSSPPSRARMLPSIHLLTGVTQSGGARSPESDELSRKVGRIELERGRGDLPEDEGQRKAHAQLILDLLVKVNEDFKKRSSYGGRDVEMAAA